MKTGELLLVLTVLGVIAYIVYKSKQKATQTSVWNPLLSVPDAVFNAGVSTGNFIDDLFSNYEFAPSDDGGVDIPTM